MLGQAIVAEGLRIASPCANRVATNGGLKKSVEAIVADAKRSVDKSIDTGSTFGVQVARHRREALTRGPHPGRRGSR